MQLIKSIPFKERVYLSQIPTKISTKKIIPKYNVIPSNKNFTAQQ